MDDVQAYKIRTKEKSAELYQQGHLQRPAFTHSKWREELKEALRVATCRITSNGLRHLICINRETFHLPQGSCVRKLCGREANDLYHIMTCIALGESKIQERAEAEGSL